MLFDAYIGMVNDFIGDMQCGGRSVKVIRAPISCGKEELSFKVGPGANPTVLLRSDTFVELGNPESGSISCLLLTENPGLISNGRITVVGPDIAESEGQSLPFGQFVVIGGKRLTDGDLEGIRSASHVGDRIEGYMERSLPGHVWSRVSKAVAGKGFGLETLGTALIEIHRSANPGIESVEVIFVTSGRADVNRLNAIADQVQKITRELARDSWKLRGYDIDCALDCSVCVDKPVCDDIREVLREREKKGLEK